MGGVRYVIRKNILLVIIYFGKGTEEECPKKIGAEVGLCTYARIVIVNSTKINYRVESTLLRRCVVRVLIVDDDENVCILVSLVVKDCGWVYVYTTNPDDALLIAKNQEFDAVISDYNLNASMNGFTLLHRINAPRKAIMSGNNCETLALMKGYKYIQKPNLEGDIQEFLSGKY